MSKLSVFHINENSHLDQHSPIHKKSNPNKPRYHSRIELHDPSYENSRSKTLHNQSVEIST